MLTDILTSFVLGLAVTINPCIVAANMSALTFVSDGFNKQNIMVRGSLYLLGRMCAYIILGIILYIFADGISIGQWIQTHFGKIIGPLFLVVGIMLLDVIHLHLHADSLIVGIKKTKIHNKVWSSLLLGFIVAYAFCPESGALYFGTMVPLLSKCDYNYFYIVAISFALGSVIPFIPIVLLISKGSNKLKEVREKHKNTEIWGRRIIASLFLIAGVLYIIEYYF